MWKRIKKWWCERYHKRQHIALHDIYIDCETGGIVECFKCGRRWKESDQ